MDHLNNVNIAGIERVVEGIRTLKIKMPSANSAIDLVVIPNIISTIIVRAVRITTHKVLCSCLWLCEVIINI